MKISYICKIAYNDMAAYHPHVLGCCFSSMCILIYCIYLFTLQIYRSKHTILSVQLKCTPIEMKLNPKHSIFKEMACRWHMCCRYVNPKNILKITIHHKLILDFCIDLAIYGIFYNLICIFIMELF